jgi:hypothetical protein
MVVDQEKLKKLQAQAAAAKGECLEYVYYVL